MVIIKFSVKGQSIRLLTDLRKTDITSDTLDYFKCQFLFDSSWDGFEVRAYFKNATYNITKSTLLDSSNYCYIPWEILAHTGIVLCNLTGTKVVNGRTIRLTAGPARLFLKNEGTIEPDFQRDPTPTEFEQFIEQVRGYAQDAQESADDAAATEARVLDMTVSSVTGEVGTPVAVTKTVVDDHYNLEFTIPRGVKGDKGDKGDRGDTGVGIASITENDDYTITIELTDGSTFTTDPIAGFTDVAFDENYDLVVTKTDGTTITLETDFGSAVSDWLDDHPEATTTVADGSLTEAKFTDSLKKKTVNQYVTPEMFGAVGDGAADDTAAVQAAFDEALLTGAGLVGAGQYLVTDTITVTATGVVNGNKIVEITGKLLANFSDRPIIIFDDCQGWRINVNAESKTANYYGGYDFTDGNNDPIIDYHYGYLPYAGVVLRNANRCEFSGIIRNCNVGLRLEGLSGGSVYNFIHGVSVWNCAYGIELYANTGGWVNNNRFDENTVSNNSGITNRDKAVAIHLFSSYNYQNNCNLFEGDYMSANGSPAILLEGGQYNEFFFRNEGHNTVIADEATSFNSFYSNFIAYSMVADGANISENAMLKLMNSYKCVADINADNVEVVAWKNSGSSYYAKRGNIIDYGAYAGGSFQNVFYGEQNPIVDGIAPNLGVFIDIQGLGSIITYIEKYNEADADVRTQIYLFNANKELISPNDGYVGSATGDTMTKDTANMRLQSGSNANGYVSAQLLDSSVKYIFVTASRQLKILRVYAKKTQAIVPFMTHFDEATSYPYFPIMNTNIVTSKQKIGKRLYSTIDGAEYICTAVAGDGTETWVKKTI